MIKAIYIGYILKRDSPTNIQRYIGLLEATLESFPQLLISTLFITTSIAYPDIAEFNPLIVISLLFSLYSLTSRVTSDDKEIYNSNWKELEFDYKKCPCKCINYRYILRVLMRFMEISSRLIIYVLLWINMGGLFTGVILCVEGVYLMFVACISGSIEILGNMMYFVIAGEGDAEHPISYFLFYRFITAYIYLILVTIFANVSIDAPKIPDYSSRNTETIESSFGLGLLIYCWISHFIWPCVGTWIGYSYANRSDDNQRSPNTTYKNISRNILILHAVQDMDGFVDLITFGSPVKDHKMVWQYISIMNQQNSDGSYIFDDNARQKAIALEMKYKNLPFLVESRRHFTAFKWNPDTNLGGLFIISMSESITIAGGRIDLSGCGYYGDNEYNIGKGQMKDNGTMGLPVYSIPRPSIIKSGNIYGNKELSGYLYHGSGQKGKSEAGGGTIVLITKNKFLNKVLILSSGLKYGTGGTIFICCKEFENKGTIKATSDGNETAHKRFDGRIAIYTDSYTNDGKIIPEPFIGTYQEGIKIHNDRSNHIRTNTIQP